MTPRDGQSSAQAVARRDTVGFDVVRTQRRRAHHRRAAHRPGALLVALLGCTVVLTVGTVDHHPGAVVIAVVVVVGTAVRVTRQVCAGSPITVYLAAKDLLDTGPLAAAETGAGSLMSTAGHLAARLHRGRSP